MAVLLNGPRDWAMAIVYSPFIVAAIHVILKELQATEESLESSA